MVHQWKAGHHGAWQAKVRVADLGCTVLAVLGSRTAGPETRKAAYSKFKTSEMGENKL